MVLCCEREHARPVRAKYGASFHQNSLVAVGGTGGKSAVQSSRFAHWSRGNLNAKRACEVLDRGRTSNASREACIGQVRHTRRRRQQLVHQFEALAIELPA